MEDFLDPRNAEGMPKMTDSMLSLDFLMAAKNGVRNCAIALTECITPEARTLIREQLNQALALHEEISQLMLSKGWLHVYNLPEQHEMDMRSARTTVQIAGLDLFPGDTSRLGMFATPNK
ncbi:spore coat protein [Paenibacillus mucilaginosus]|uniref:Putative spore coat protein F n=2 Tax=Paenibacillus mucilaginosus TaxID=61624 RepID=H6NTT3_9BACL|nr:spore coat protein [Paenibacillus mucilaginosus]AEI39408.1 putative spore coat protein F [Paenibacillus mucilaginosus KNP414]AFC27677.1 putative spore coat protein F [Paenibacillus mucilaginosus 3016]MCG7214754.1 spore coat protein [Paenibacillus mucilaginosus]WDM28388.1 spore coat protein [Paenibacillus mucilaginosus]WFA16560.1 spore coat protein [Paenibacillus mucilaginosus]